MNILKNYCLKNNLVVNYFMKEEIFSSFLRLICYHFPVLYFFRCGHANAYASYMYRDLCNPFHRKYR